jgi:hypothetical protein
VRLLVSSVLLTLAWFAAANAVASAAAWVAARHVCRRAGESDERPRPHFLLALRLLPATAAAFVAFVLFLPIHLATEATDAVETFGGLLWALALLSMAMVLAAVVRVARARSASRRLRTAWTAHSSAGATPIVQDSGMRGMSLAGILHTIIVV